MVRVTRIVRIPASPEPPLNAACSPIVSVSPRGNYAACKTGLLVEPAAAARLYVGSQFSNTRHWFNTRKGR
jgi:hypothetical protein